MSSAKNAKPLLSPADRRRRNRAEVTNAILETSRSNIRENGAAGLDLNEVARQLGMKTPSLYEYFPNKMAIYEALFRLGIGKFRQRMEQNPGESATIWQRLRFTLDAYFTFAHEDPELYQIVFERPLPGFVPSEEGMRECFAAFGYLSDGLARAKAAGEIETDLSPEQAYYLVSSVIHGLTALHIANEPQLPFGEGRFGSLIPAATALFKAAWEPHR